MPNEALENLILDAIEAELAKIGTAPTSNWFTTPAPTIKVGVPGDPIKGPNQCSLYLQHVGSDFAQNNVLLTHHRLECDFDIWCISSHPVDGKKRAYDLAADVNRALRRADRTFYELFQYGLEFGDLSFRADEMLVRAGNFAVSQRIRIHADRAHEDDMTPAQVRALIKEALQQAEFFRWDHDEIYPTTSIPPFYGVRNAVQSSPQKIRGGCLFLDTATGVNKVWSAGLGFNSIVPISQGLSGHADVFGFDWYFAMRQNRGNPTGVNAGEKFQGIGWGDTFSVDTPWATNYVSDGTANSTVQLRFNHVSEQWEVLVFVADGNPPDVHVCDIQPEFSVDNKLVELALSWEAATSTLRAFLNRQLAKTIVDTRGLSTGNGCAPYIFWTNGSGAGSFASEVGYYQGKIWMDMPIG